MAKKRWVIFLLLFAVLMIGCSKEGSNRPSTTGESTNPPLICISPPDDGKTSLLYYEEFISLLRDVRANGMPEDWAQKRPELAQFVKAIADGEAPLMLPYWKEEPAPMELHEGYPYILVELKSVYSLPSITFFCQGEGASVSIEMIYVTGSYKAMMADMTFSQFMERNFPDSPNIHNLKDFPEYRAIYERQIETADGKVLALIKETVEKTEYKSFVKDSFLITICGRMGVATDEWLKYLHFETVDLEQISAP